MSKPEINENLMSINTIASCLSFKAENNDTNILDFLNNLLISDVNSINTNQFQYSALCNPKGRIIATFWIHIIDQAKVNIICAKNMQETLIQFFNARKFRLKINIQSTKKQLVINHKSNRLQLIDDETTAIYTATLDDFYLFLFRQNLPWVDSSNSEKFIPQHVNLDQHENIMSFSKGCYPGQEIIARIKYLGTIKKRMTQLEEPHKDTLIQQLQGLELVSPIIYDCHKNSYNIQVIKNSF